MMNIEINLRKSSAESAPGAVLEHVALGHIYIYIYTYREREREIYIYIYV